MLMIFEFCSIQANLYSNVIVDLVDFLNGTGAIRGTLRAEWAPTYAALVYTLGNEVYGSQDLSP